LPEVIRERPALAVSHGSRSQLVVSALLGIPSLVIADYEFAKAWAGITPTWVMVPKVIPTEAIKTRPDRVLHYPGIKEDVYVPRLRVNPHLRAGLGVGADDIMVTIRPPATEAHYHNPEAEELLREAVEHLSSHPGVRMVVVPRHAKQAQIIRTTWPALVESSRIIFPGRVVDGLNLIWHSDLVISGGGTMNREAAALGVPVYSIFRGLLGAVDRFLAGEQRLVVLTSAAEVRSKLQIERRNRRGDPPVEAKRALGSIVEHIEFILASGSRELATTKAK
jgi:predicted glycosyltransferase